MRILHMLGCFKLPDGFAGTNADALRLLANHLEDGSLPNYTDWKVSKEEDDAWFSTFQAAYPTLQAGKYRFHGSIAVGEYA